MRHCLLCKDNYPSGENTCPSCGRAPARLGVFESYAPELSYAGGGFDAVQFSELFRLEAENFWFRARNELILWAMRKYAEDLGAYLEIGCGTGFVLSGVAGQFPDARLHGSEIFVDGLEFAFRRAPSAKLMQMDARRIPFRDEFNAIGAFDVLEHIEEDVAVIREVGKALKPGGLFLMTVPQHNWMWSPADEYAHHVRRYSAVDLHRKLEMSGFSILRSTSFVSVLLPAMFLSRKGRVSVESGPGVSAELAVSPVLNKMLYKVMHFEAGLIRAGFNFPFGGSRLVVARKLEQDRIEVASEE